jgi:hypothetical protein
MSHFLRRWSECRRVASGRTWTTSAGRCRSGGMPPCASWSLRSEKFIFILERGSFPGNSMEHIFGLECEKQVAFGVGDSKGSFLFIFERGSFLGNSKEQNFVLECEKHKTMTPWMGMGVWV